LVIGILQSLMMLALHDVLSRITTATQPNADDDEAFVGSPVGSLTGHCSGVGGYE
jgi:hypothetical protein